MPTSRGKFNQNPSNGSRLKSINSVWDNNYYNNLLVVVVVVVVVVLVVVVCDMHQEFVLRKTM